MKVPETEIRRSLADAFISAGPTVLFHWVNAPDWPVEFVSENVDRFGYTAEAFIDGTTRFAEIVHPEDVERVANEVKGHIASRQDDFIQVYRLITRDGDVRWVEDRTIVERDAAGEATHFLGILLDITREKQLQLAWRDSESRFRHMVENLDARHIFFNLDVDGSCRYVSPSVEQILGYTPEEFKAGFPDRFLTKHPVNRGDRWSGPTAPSKAEDRRRELDILRKDGTTCRLEVTRAPHYDENGNLVAWDGVAQDISERVYLYEVACRNRDRLARAEQAAQVGNWEWNLVDGHVFWSDEVYLIFGLSPRSIEPDPDTFRRHLHPQDRERVRKAIKSALEGYGAYDARFRIVRPDGEVRHVHSQAKIVYDKGGDAAVMAGTLLDETEHWRFDLAGELNLDKYRALIETTSDLVWEVDANGVFTYCSPKAEEFFGYPADEVLGKTPFDFMPKPEAVRVQEVYRSIIEKQRPFSGLENINVHRDGHEVVLETSGMPFFDVRGDLAGYRGIDRDITRRKQTERKVRNQKKLLHTVLDGVRESIMVIDPDHNMLLMNKTARESMQLHAVSDPQHPKCYEVFRGVHAPCHGEETPCPLNTVISSGEPATVVHVCTGENGLVRYLELVATPVPGTGDAPEGIIETARDITPQFLTQQRLEDQKEVLERLAHHDTLTGLPNRLLFLDRLQQAIGKARRNNRHLAVLFIDLDKFKPINDNFGHATGDVVLKIVARRLRDGVREEDTVARLGGDEFTVVVEDLNRSEHASVLAQKLIRVLQEPVEVEGKSLSVSASVGISLFPQDGETASELLSNADAAMYKAKHERRGTLRFFTEDMTERAFERVLMEAHLRRALERREFVLYYQSEVHLRTGALIGLEALVRWEHPEMGLLPPARFVPLAEDTGLILDLGEWILRTACARMAAWRRSGLKLARVAVNITANQLQDEGFPPMVDRILFETGCLAEWLELEVTENILMEQKSKSPRVLDTLTSLGIHLALDDFGSGCSSLADLARSPLSKLKIDGTFVRGVAPGSPESAIAHAAIAMGKSLGLEVIAEGVETEAQKAFLRSAGCYEVQGYVYGHPMPEEDMRSKMENWSAET
ncbi:MAG: EAL domain-containing protein [Pseudomonadota bacterium]|nr:EAL domain-containing protein [Pseudomonadota bacterium]